MHENKTPAPTFIQVGLTPGVCFQQFHPLTTDGVISTICWLPANCHLLILFQHQCWSRSPISSHHHRNVRSLAVQRSLSSYFQRGIYHTSSKEARTWCDQCELISADLELICSLETPGMPCRSSTDGVSVAGWPRSTSPVWVSTGSFYWNCCPASARRYSPGCWPWWPSCSSSSGSVSSFWYGQSSSSVGALAADFWYWRYSSALVSVIPVIQETARTSRSQCVVGHLPGLRSATRIRSGPDPLCPVYIWSPKSDRQLRMPTTRRFMDSVDRPR